MFLFGSNKPLRRFIWFKSNRTSYEASQTCARVRKESDEVRERERSNGEGKESERMRDEEEEKE